MTYFLRQVFAIGFIGIVSVVFAISFAAIIYTGELAPFFGQGIGLALAGSTVVAICGAFTLSYRGSIIQPQDVPAILLAGTVGVFVSQQQLSGETLFATVACLVGVASMVTGLVAILVGQLRLAMLARYIPYPVLAGFLAATGLLLFLGGVGVAVGHAPEIGNLSEFFAADALIKWGPMAIAAIAIVFATRTYPGHLTLPLALIATAIGFLAIVALLGLSEDQARADGFLLGPFQSGSFLGGVGPQILGQADWAAIASQVPVIFTIVAISMIGTVLNASGLELELDRDLDINQDVRGVGIANSLGALVGGMPGYHLLGETLLASRLGLAGPMAGLASAAGCLIILLIGGAVLQVMPVGLFASVIAFLGLDLLYTWLWGERKNLKLRDYLIVVFIPIIAVTFSFLMAIAVGLVVAFVLFLVAYAKLDVVRAQNTVAVRRSFVERPDHELAVLANAGRHAQIIELSGFLFFASANVLRDRVQGMLSSSEQVTRWIILDFKHVSGVDISTWHMLQRLSGDCERAGVTVVVSGMGLIEGQEKQAVSQQFSAIRFGTLDQALEHVEDAILENQIASTQADDVHIFEEIKTLFPLGMVGEFVEEIRASAGDIVIEAGSASEDIYVLLTGHMSVLVGNEGGSKTVVAQIRAGSIIGEMAYYSGGTRSADIVADGDVTLQRIDMKRLAEVEQAHPGVAAGFHKLIARQMARRLSRTTVLLRDLGF